MKKVLVFLLLLTIPVAAFAAAQLLGNSLMQSGSYGVYQDYLDYTMRAENIGILDQRMCILGIGAYTWGNRMRGAYVYTPGRAINFYIAPNSQNNKNDRNTDPLNQPAELNTTSFTNYKDSRDDSQYGFGYARDLGNGRGWFLDVLWARDTVDRINYRQNINKMNKTATYRTSAAFEHTTLMHDDITLQGEYAWTAGDLIPQMNLTLRKENGFAESDKYVRNVTNFFLGNSIVKNTGITERTGNNTDITVINNFSPDDLPNITCNLDAEFQKNNSIGGGTVYLIPTFGMRMNKKDYTYTTYTEVKTYQSNAPNNIITHNETTTKYILHKCSDINYGLGLRWKKKWQLDPTVNVGVYPRVTGTMRSYSAEVEKTWLRNNRIDNNNNGIFTDPGDANTETTSIGDTDSIKYSQFNMVMQLPIGMQWSVSKILTFFCGSQFQITYTRTKTYYDQMSTYETTSLIDHNNPANNATTANPLIKNKYNIKSRRLTTLNNLRMGVTLNIGDKIKGRLLANANNHISFERFSAEIIYLLSPGNARSKDTTTPDAVK